MLHNHFTPGLGQAILNNLQELQKSIREDYRFEVLPSQREARRLRLAEQQRYYQSQRSQMQQAQAQQDPNSQTG